eukprot:1137403-Pelagomonas_calceolata.AAC.1
MPSCSCRHHHAECARRPNKKDQVKVVQFILDEQAMYVGRTGTLIAMDASNEGIIKLDTGEVIVMDMSCIGKLGSQLMLRTFDEQCTGRLQEEEGLQSKRLTASLFIQKEYFMWPAGKRRKDYASQVQLRALRKGPLTSKLACWSLPGSQIT